MTASRTEKTSITSFSDGENLLNFANIFVKKRASQFQFCSGVNKMFLKDVTNVPTCSQSILSKLKLGKIRQELTVENVHVENHGVRDACLTKWR